MDINESKFNYVKKLRNNSNMFYRKYLPELATRIPSHNIEYKDKQDFLGGRYVNNKIYVYSTSSFDNINNEQEYANNKVDFFGVEISNETSDEFIYTHELGHSILYNILNNNPTYKQMLELKEKADKSSDKRFKYYFNQIKHNSLYGILNEGFARAMETTLANKLLNDDSVSKDKKDEIQKLIKSRDEYIMSIGGTDESQPVYENIDEYNLEYNFIYDLIDKKGEKEIINTLENIDLFKVLSIKRSSKDKLTDEYRKIMNTDLSYFNIDEKTFELDPRLKIDRVIDYHNDKFFKKGVQER